MERAIRLKSILLIGLLQQDTVSSDIRTCRTQVVRENKRYCEYSIGEIYSEKNGNTHFCSKKCQGRQYRQNHPDMNAAISRRYRQNYPDRVAASKRRWRKDHPDNVKMERDKYNQKLYYNVRLVIAKGKGLNEIICERCCSTNKCIINHETGDGNKEVSYWGNNNKFYRAIRDGKRPVYGFSVIENDERLDWGPLELLCEPCHNKHHRRGSDIK